MFADGFKRRYTTIPFAYSQLFGNDSQFVLFTHHHKEIEIIAMYEGEAEMYIGSSKHLLRRGDVLIVPPYCVHRGTAEPGTRYDCICFKLELIWDKEMRERLEEGRLIATRHLGSDDACTAEVNRFVKEAVNAAKAALPGWEMEAIGLMSMLMSRLKAENFFTELAAPVQENKFEKSVIKYIKEHYSEHITSTSLANALYLNNSYFCRLFKRSFNCCFSDYLLQYRIAQAKIFLNTQPISVSEVALKCGFNSFSYFSKAFKGAVGISPTEYRIRHKPIKA